ncbi:MAG TPA: hypothetical protein VFF06_05190 [Polyangia bacterium]|nr:hypothetical protein [Polyangia bacterium]
MSYRLLRAAERDVQLPPLRIYYRRRARSLEIVRVYHQSRRPIAK